MAIITQQLVFTLEREVPDDNLIDPTEVMDEWRDDKYDRTFELFERYLEEQDCEIVSIELKGVTDHDNGNQ